MRALLTKFINTMRTIALRLGQRNKVRLTRLLLQTLKTRNGQIIVRQLLFNRIVTTILTAMVVNERQVPPAGSCFSQVTRAPYRTAIRVLITTLAR